MIRMEDVTARYPQAASHALQDVTLDVPQHRTLVLLGGSGSGKSTVLKCLLRLLKPESGRIEIDGRDISGLDPIELRRSIGMVFQGIALFPTMTVRENIGLVLTLAGWGKPEIRTRVDELLDLIGLDPREYSERYPHTLSGGQQQRVGVARALAPRPSYLLMDEPFGALDAITRRMLQDEIKTLRRKLDITILFVTHDLMEAVILGDRIAVMDGGRLLQQGTLSELLETPAADEVRNLVSRPLAEMREFITGERFEGLDA